MNIEIISVLTEVKEVLRQFDNRLIGVCYNPSETECECTMCKINNLIKKLDQ